MQSFYEKSFVNRLHLVLHACVEIFDVMFFVFTGFMEWELNTASVTNHSTWLARMAGDTAGENNIQIDKSRKNSSLAVGWSLVSNGFQSFSPHCTSTEMSACLRAALSLLRVVLAISLPRWRRPYVWTISIWVDASAGLSSNLCVLLPSFQIRILFFLPQI